MAEGIIYDGRASEIDSDARRRFEAESHAPGERLRPVSPSRVRGGSLEERHAELAGAMQAANLDVLTVKAVIATDDLRIEHEFEELPGRWNAGLFEDARGCEHLYGCVINREDGAWLVPLTQDFDTPKADPAHPPVALVPKMERHAVWQIGEEDAGKLDGTVGEFVVAPAEGGRHVIVGIPWTSEAGEKETAEAERAVSLCDAAGLAP